MTQMCAGPAYSSLPRPSTGSPQTFLKRAEKEEQGRQFNKNISIGWEITGAKDLLLIL